MKTGQTREGELVKLHADVKLRFKLVSHKGFDSGNLNLQEPLSDLIARWGYLL